MAKSMSSLRKFNIGASQSSRTEDQTESLVKVASIAVKTDENLKPKKMNKEDFLKSVGMDHRPGSHMAITAWEEYQAS